MFSYKAGDFTDVTKVRIWGWGDILDDPSVSHVIIRILISKRVEGRVRVREAGVLGWCDYWIWRWKGVTSQGMQAASRSWNRQGMDSPLKLPEGMQPCLHLVCFYLTSCLILVLDKDPGTWLELIIVYKLINKAMISPSFVKLETPTLLIISSFYKTYIVGCECRAPIYNICQTLCLAFLLFPLPGLSFIPHSICTTECCALQTAIHMFHYQWWLQ